MLTKMYDTIKNFIKNNFIVIIFLISFLIILNYPVNYLITVSGGTININDRVSIENEYETKGSLNLSYVTEIRGTIPTLLLSYIIPDWEKVPLSDYKINKEETSSDIDKRSKIFLKDSEQSAIKVAYTSANKEFKINDIDFTIVYVSDEVKENLKIGDTIIKIDDIDFKDMDEYRKIVDGKEVGDSVKLLINRNGKDLEESVKIKNIDNNKVTGISVLPLYDYDVDPDINFEFKDNESGSSGGLMLTLAIYNKLVKEDITKGLKITGTGTIDYEGNAGRIDGVKYKLMGAVKAKSDVFIVPLGDNYDECIKLKKEKKYDIKIIGVSTFSDALEKLKSI